MQNYNSITDADIGVTYPEGNIPDLGSIFLVDSYVRDYRLNEEDVPKLNLIANAALGSTALCVDTGNLYTLTKSGWVLLGDQIS